MVRNIGLYKRAEELRKQGMSYSDLKRELGIPKSTLSEWFSPKRWSRKMSVKHNIKVKGWIKMLGSEMRL